MSMAQAPPGSEPPIGDYAHDGHARTIADTGRECPKVKVVEHAGEHVPYDKPIEVDENFVPKLIAFEKVVVAEAKAVFGQAPSELIHRGGYRCRPVTGSKSKWSEHAFGNAIDIAGFAFGEGDERFIVDVGDDWRQKSGEAGKRAEFLHRIVHRAIHERLFRIILGPGDPGHEELLHLDFGTSWYVRVELPEDVEVTSEGEAVTASDEADEDEHDEEAAPATPPPRVRVLSR